MTTKLVLFDIDGTLVRPNGAGRAALQRALTELFGTAGPIDSLPMSGKTDRQIITELLAAANFDPGLIEARLPACFQAIARHMAETTRECQVQTCPGVPALLKQLSARPDVVLGLLTGNLQTTAPIKLRAVNIDPTLFRIGAYGNDGHNRPQLPAVAVTRARALTGREFQGKNVIIVGDTPADVTCGSPLGVTAIGVATGRYSVEALEAAGADYVFPDLTDTHALVRVMVQAYRRSG